MSENSSSQYNEEENSSLPIEEDSEKDLSNIQSLIEPSTGLENLPYIENTNINNTLLRLYANRRNEYFFTPSRNYIMNDYESNDNYIEAEREERSGNNSNDDGDDIENHNYYPYHYGNSIDEVYENITYWFNTEKNKIKSDKEKLIKANQLFKENQLSINKGYENKVKLLNKAIDSYNNDSIGKDTNIIELDIGGTFLLTTSIATLTKHSNSLLAAYFNRPTIELLKRNGKIFLDRNGATFKLLLQYLRNDSLPRFASITEENDFFQEIFYWQIPLNSFPIPFQFDYKKCNENLKLEQYSTVLQKDSNHYGIVFLNQPLNALSSYVEFKLTIDITSKTKENAFIIGLIDTSKYKHDSFLSSYWKESPLSFYWDVFNTTLSKTNVNRIEIASKSGYGCICNDIETTIAIEYNQINRTVCFYKNNHNLGIAFHDVPPNLVPSFNISFDKGTIHLLPLPSHEETIFL